jgi:tetratricopeptide (TPR) repeat protein
MTEALTGRRLAAAQRYIEVGQNESALELLAGLDAETARTTYAHRLRGFAHFGLEQFDEAARAAQEGLSDDPEDEGLLYLLSLAEEARGNLAAAERAILAALEFAPEEAELLCQYADVLMRAGQLDKAERILGHAAAASPDSADVLAARVSLAYLRHDERKARELSEQLLALDPQSVRGQRMLGVLDWQRGKTRVASERFAEAVRADPSDDWAASSARTTRTLSNPLLWPSRFFTRFGAGPTWIAAIAIIFSLRALELQTAATVASLVWIVMCVSSWIARAMVSRR